MEQRLFGSTRGRILELLWRGCQTVDDLARALDLTDNAVRSHLVALERDGLVRQEGIRRGPRRPALVYVCTASAEQLLAKPYSAVLETVVAELRHQLGGEATTELLRRVGEQLAGRYRSRFIGLDRDGQVEQMRLLLRELGGIGDVVEWNGGYQLRGSSCPLLALVSAHPEACVVLQSLLESLLDGAQVDLRCQHEGSPRCRFAIGFADSR